MTRHLLREHCFKILFGLDFYADEEIKVQTDNYFESPSLEDEDDELIHDANFSDVDIEYIKSKAMLVMDNKSEIDKIISELSQGWKLERIGRVERNILRLAIAEMKYDDDIPVSVAINEAVELAKAYGRDESYSFVNAILSKVGIEE
ncbi:transcription antitermination factor NusB [Lachnoanaerobaculum sp. Marseille-Q4761]|uniref:transcription antitermination factor NusB n=1 Tax=Lachnoanaerobaculum sp. Marseille-Q4761 TaxID=2819511 RepID=UPI001AA1D05E|nr:transcription antitermination factor NusB [Lachnoanaerobaculum sp. Marseille-Q4761]MBO1871879.1 transcription antitermination factor NusB [Lachnoanaerobaculum sp. Marseille-Q4761]